MKVSTVKKRNKQKKYPGELGKETFWDTTEWLQIAERAKGGHVAKLEYDARLVAAAEQRLDEVIAMLFQHYNIGPDEEDRWEELAKCLAEDHVPAAKLVPNKPRGPGASKKWVP